MACNRNDSKQTATADETDHVEKFKIDTSSLSALYKHKIDTFISNHSKGNNLSGQFLAAKGNKIYINSFGKARYLDGKDITNQDVFQIASVSKFITALCIVKMMEEKIISASDTVSKILTDFPYNNITIHHLLSHSSGLCEYTYLTDTAWCNDTFTKCNHDGYNTLICCGQPLSFEPGKRYKYCNSNFMVLANIAEKKLNLPFEAIVKKYIIKPLGLDSTHVYNVTKRPLSSYPVWGMRGDHSYIPDHRLNNISGDKSIFLNVYELFIIYKAFKNNKIVSKKYKKLMLEEHSNVRHNQFYGYGIRKIVLDNGETWYYHNGWWHGFRSYFWFNLKDDKCAILLTNRLKGGFINTQNFIGLLE